MNANNADVMVYEPEFVAARDALNALLEQRPVLDAKKNDAKKTGDARSVRNINAAIRDLEDKIDAAREQVNRAPAPKYKESFLVELLTSELTGFVTEADRARSKFMADLAINPAPAILMNVISYYGDNVVRAIAVAEFATRLLNDLKDAADLDSMLVIYDYYMQDLSNDAIYRASQPARVYASISDAVDAQRRSAVFELLRGNFMPNLRQVRSAKQRNVIAYGQ
jgi:hypothetical protein